MNEEIKIKEVSTCCKSDYRVEGGSSPSERYFVCNCCDKKTTLIQTPQP